MLTHTQNGMTKKCCVAFLPLPSGAHVAQATSHTHEITVSKLILLLADFLFIFADALAEFFIKWLAVKLWMLPVTLNITHDAVRSSVPYHNALCCVRPQRRVQHQVNKYFNDQNDSCALDCSSDANMCAMCGDWKPQNDRKSPCNWLKEKHFFFSF